MRNGHIVVDEPTDLPERTKLKLQLVDVPEALDDEAREALRFHYTPTSASWLNQVEGFFGILAKQFLRATEFLSTKQLRAHIAS